MLLALFLRTHSFLFAFLIQYDNPGTFLIPFSKGTQVLHTIFGVNKTLLALTLIKII